MFNTKTKALGLVLSLASVNAMALTVSTTNDANLLANEILGSGITISNATYTGTATQSATYADGSVIGMETGILLTSGDANLAVGPNVSDGAGVALGTAGDASLDGLIPGTTNDAAVLEFDFVSAGGDLFFDFVFASEEYNEWVDSSFNDVFGFFVDGVNIALAPDGQVASVNNINCGNPFVGVGPNCDSFNNNDPTSTSTPFDIEYDGFTDVLVAEALGLGGGTHHIKIAIADASDTALDSAVFIQGGSFTDKPPVIEPPIETPEPGILALLGLGLAGMTVMRRRKQV